MRSSAAASILDHIDIIIPSNARPTTRVTSECIYKEIFICKKIQACIHIFSRYEPLRRSPCNGVRTWEWSATVTGEISNGSRRCRAQGSMHMSLGNREDASHRLSAKSEDLPTQSPRVWAGCTTRMEGHSRRQNWKTVTPPHAGGNIGV